MSLAGARITFHHPLLEYNIYIYIYVWYCPQPRNQLRLFRILVIARTRRVRPANLRYESNAIEHIAAFRSQLS